MGLFITSAGLVGIGTSLPGATLEVAGSARFFGGSGTDGLLTIGSTGASNDAVIIKYDNANDRLQFYNWGASGSNQNTFVIDNANSRVGIGTSAPGSRFTVNRVNSADASATGATTLSNAGITVEATTDTNSRLMFGIGSTGSVPWIQAQNTSSNATQSLILNPVGGNVGIGTTPTTDILEIYGNLRFAQVSNYLKFANDSITIKRNGANALEFNSYNGFLFNDTLNSTERFRCDSSGRLLVGTSTARSVLNWGTLRQQFEGTSYTDGLLVFNNANNIYPAVIGLGKSRGTTVGSNTIVASGDQFGEIAFYGADGTNPARGATIGAYVDGTPGANDMPGRIVLATTADGASSPTERMRISSSGLFTAVSIYNNTTGSSANVVIRSDGVFERSTSSIKYKTDIEDLQDSYADAILNCRPIWYRSTWLPPLCLPLPPPGALPRWSATQPMASSSRCITRLTPTTAPIPLAHMAALVLRHLKATSSPTPTSPLKSSSAGCRRSLAVKRK
jgi:hypothetical protein